MAAMSPHVDATLAGVAALDETLLARPWVFRDQPMDVRYALYRTLEEAQEALVGVAARPVPESRRALALAQRGFGDLRGLLIGLPDALLDAAPGAGEWTVRETLRHILLVERRYALSTLHAIARADADPVRLPDDRLPAAAEIDVTGGIGEILARIGHARAETNRQLGDVPPAAMTRPTVWARHHVDVRFRLHRFAAHLVEHTIQCEKTLAALGRQPAEGRRILRRLAALVGEIEGLGGTAEAREIETRLAERFTAATSR